MDALEAILSRRSIRTYTAESVPESVIDELLQAAMSAPSAGNDQPWHFIVIRNRRILDEIPNCQPYSGPLKEASVAIIACGDTKTGKNTLFWSQACSAAIENILIVASAKGVGAVWLGLHPRERWVAAIRKLLGIPEHVIPLGIVSIGYPAEEKPPADRYDPSKIHHNWW